jgi:small subunit ribosomal protein S4
LCRREGVKLYLKGSRCDGPKCPIVKKSPARNYPPGQHGQRRTRRPSEYGLQLREKQKVRRYYGVLETQFRKIYAEAERKGGVTGDNLLQLLESRLDNTVFRMGFADSRQQARQLVRHGHFTVNGRKTDIPSFQVRAGDVIAVKSESRGKEYFVTGTDLLQSKQAPEWVSVSPTELSGRVITLPTRDQMEIPQFNEALIVEYYSR